MLWVRAERRAAGEGAALPVEISVVVPTFRRPALLAEAIRSVTAQDGVEVEILVVDDSPEGSAREVVEGLRDPRVSYRKMPLPTGGQPATVRNEGLGSTRAPILHFLDDDDRVAPGSYRAVLEAFAANPDRGVVFGRVEPFAADGIDLRHEQEVFGRAARCARRYRRLDSRFLQVAHTFFTASPLFVCSACYVRRDVALAAGGFDREIAHVEDLDFYTRAIRASGSVFLDRDVLEYRVGAGSIMDAHRAGGGNVNPGSARRMYAKYREAHGGAELLALKLLGKGVLRWL